MNLEDATRQESGQPELTPENRGEAPKVPRSGEASTAGQGSGRSGTDHLIEQVVERGNLLAALKRVRQNQGSPGVDAMTVEELPAYLRAHWTGIREQLLAGEYKPRPVKRQEIPKPGGGVRTLGIPTVLDRFIQQAILQVLQPIFDPSFSRHSYGFRPGRSAHDAIEAARRYIQEGRTWVVDIDLEAFFDRVNHDVLMGRLAKRIGDKRLLKLIRRYLEAGMMANGVVMERREGTPQGGPFSPLLANVLLDEIDRELEKRGHAFVRYADDCNIYVRSEKAGNRTMEGMKALLGKLRLKVNESKSAVAKVWDRKFLGYGFWSGPGGVVKRRVAPKALERMKDKVREITGRNNGRSMATVVADLGAYLRGWKEYFRRADTPKKFHELDGWIRRRLILVQVKHWKRGSTAYRKLRARGFADAEARRAAALVRRWWIVTRHHTINAAFPAAYFRAQGVPSLAA